MLEAKLLTPWGEDNTHQTEEEKKKHRIFPDVFQGAGAGAAAEKKVFSSKCTNAANFIKA